MKPVQQVTTILWLRIATFDKFKELVDLEYFPS